jgi:hypothetical protein
MTQLRSLAHPEWPYAGSAHEWRGFVRDETKDKPKELSPLTALAIAVYQKQNFGPELK